MTDVPADAPSGISAGRADPAVAPARVPATADYTRVFEEQQPRLVAYARSLTGNSWVADDLVAEAHFRVWRRLSGWHEIENVPAYLMTTVRHLAATVGRGAAGRETPRDPQAPETVGISGLTDSPFGALGTVGTGSAEQDPAARVSSVDLLTRVLGQLPERWVKALWLAEAEGQPLDAIGRRIGAGRGATAVLLHRAREGMRQAFLRAHPGTPENPACEPHWDRMPGHIRGEASPRQSERLLDHLDDCADCRARLALLTRANTRLPALAGPALLVFVLGGSGKFLLPLAAGSATGAAAGHGGGLLHGMRHVLTGGGKMSAVAAGAVATTVAGAAVAAGLVLTGSDEPSLPQQRVVTAESGVPQPPPPPWQAPEKPQKGTEQEKGTGKGTDAEPEPGKAAPEQKQGSAPKPGAAPKSETGSGQSSGQRPAGPPAQRPEAENPAEKPDAPAPPPHTQGPATRPPATQTPATEAPATPPVETPTPTPTPTPTDTVPTPTPTPTPVDPTPVEPTPVDPTPVEPTPEPPVCEPWIGPIYICHQP
ncbi:sigma factor [Streptomyces sp. NPDC087300]|uniref:sigma factor n=1 Tax=Streptomyces sp. NPDC087300 TaxID=3365780 RepID=UPI0037FC7727